jgi:RNA polymerase sigma factor (sigma-70 family)
MATMASRWMKVEDQPSGFDRLFIAEYDRVVRIAYRIVGRLDEAEDVAQEVFCSFYRNHSADAFYATAWLHRAAAHSALNHIRSQKRRVRREMTEAMDSQRLQQSAEWSLDPEHSAEANERHQEVRDALSRLSPKSASVLALRHSGLSYSEVAEATNVNVSQVGTLLRRAENALKKEMDHAPFE